MNVHIVTFGFSVFLCGIFNFEFVLSQNCEAPKIDHDFGNFDTAFFKSVLKRGKEDIMDDLNEENVSLVVSPFYLKLLLLIISLGISNSSLNELYSILNMECCEKDEAKFISQKMVYGIWDNDTKVDGFHMLFFDNTINLKPSFKSLLTMYNMTMHEINYENNNKALQQINQLIKDRSKTFIGEMFEMEDVIDAAENIAIFSNAYFKAKWLTPPTVLNGTRDFYINKKETAQMKMFRITQEMRYSNIEDIDAQVVDIPYSNCGLSIMIFVPNSKDGLNEMEEKLLSHNDLLDYVDEYLKNTPVAVILPKYSLESLIFLPNKLQDLGVNKLFLESADLEEMIGKQNAHISVAIQRVIVWVSEGRTAFKDTGDPEYPIPEKIIVADRPHFFLIKSNKNIMFMGHFYK